MCRVFILNFPIYLCNFIEVRFHKRVFSNPFDVIKTRQQLQGELQKNTKSKLPYRGLGQAIITIVKAEGLKGLQKGLGSALGFQFVMNSTRLGLYETVDQLGWTRYSKTKDHAPGLCVLWGMLTIN